MAKGWYEQPLAAEFVNEGKVYKAVRYPIKMAKGSFTVTMAKRCAKGFAHPVEFARITSGF